jgi:Na+/H+ antiporter NhaD/arsenite permease-like protein
MHRNTGMSFIMKCAFHYNGLGHPFLSAVLDNIPKTMATRNAKGELVVIAVRKKAKHTIAKRFR